MTREEIIRMARKAGMFVTSELEGQTDKLERFAALVAAHEREECIKALEDNEQFYCRDTLRARGTA